MDEDIDCVAVALLRKLKPEVQTEVLNSSEFTALPDGEQAP
ncbi:hypothetical protein ACIA8R_08890 [Nonomuraea sp. NPDC051191]